MEKWNHICQLFPQHWLRWLGDHSQPGMVSPPSQKRSFRRADRQRATGLFCPVTARMCCVAVPAPAPAPWRTDGQSVPLTATERWVRFAHVDETGEKSNPEVMSNLLLPWAVGGSFRSCVHRHWDISSVPAMKKKLAHALSLGAISNHQENKWNPASPKD